MEEITLNSIYKDINSLANESAIEQQISVEKAITDLLLDYLKHEGIATSPELVDCYDTKTKPYCLGFYKINAFDYSDDSGVLDLFITYYIDKEEVPEFTKSKIEACHNAAYRFFMRCIESESMLNEQRELNPDMAEVIEMIRDEYKKKNIKQVRIIILSNGVVKSDYIPNDDYTISNQNIPIEEYLWDIEATRQSELANVSNPTVNVDLESMFQPLECIQCEETSEVKSYLAVMPAMLLAQIYHRYRARLLNQNVRNFLGGKKKHNSNMLNTIRKEGGRFFSYNNGISSTALNVNVETNDEGRLVIKSLTDWQIVNGGQTTNVIYYIYSQKKERELLNNVNVALKITEIKVADDTRRKSAISNIAKFANSQQEVKTSDFAVNEPYMLNLKEMSNKEIAPQNSARPGTKWFFVRMRGEYEVAKMSLSLKKCREFIKIHPKNQVLQKTDVAMLETAWNLLPHDSCSGGEKCFDKFLKSVVNNEEIVVDEKYFHRLVAKSIIAQKTKELFFAGGGKAYANIIQYYVLAIISLKSRGRYNLDYVWDNQEVQPQLLPIIQEAINIVSTYIQALGADVTQINITSAVKKIDFWKAINLRSNKIKDLDSILLMHNNVEELTSNQKAQLSAFAEISAKDWESIALWGKSTRKLSLLERKKIEHIAVSIINDKQIPTEYAIEAMETYSKVKAMGWK